MKLAERISLFTRGWRRRSAPMLDAAGCPLWLQKRRCPTLKGWGRILRQLDAMQWNLSAEALRQLMIDELEAGEGEG